MVDLARFHFDQPYWLLALGLPVLLWWVPKAELREAYRDRVKHFADAHLLSYLIVHNETESDKRRHAFFVWSVIWALAVLAMAGPRWDYTDLFIAKSNTDVVVLLDMSRSMEAEDVHPNRFVRARQEVGDLLRQPHNCRVGLIGFASVAHVVAPVTEDLQTLLHVLPALSPSLVSLTGSRLSQALQSGRRLLLSQPADNGKVMLLVSDGGFDETGLVNQVVALHNEGIQLFVLGIGSMQDAIIPDGQGGALQVEGEVVTSTLDEVGLQALAVAGQGAYWRAGYHEDDTAALVRQLAAQTKVVRTQASVRVWHERFYLPLGLMMLVLLLHFARQRTRVGK